jgi:hypothetical protein
MFSGMTVRFGEAQPDLGRPGSSHRRRRFSTPDRRARLRELRVAVKLRGLYFFGSCARICSWILAYSSQWFEEKRVNVLPVFTSRHSK